MAIRQDKIQISLEFFTDESKAFAKTILDTQKFNSEMSKAQGEVSKLQKEFEKLSAAGKDTTDVELKLAEANKKVSTSFKEALNSGQSLAGLDLSKIIPAQLGQRLAQIKQQLSTLAPEFVNQRAPLIAEAQALETQIKKNRASIQGVSEEMNNLRTNSSRFFTGLTSFVATATIAFVGLQRLASALFKPSQLASEMEQAMIAFETMLGSAQQAKKLVNDVIKLAATTPFEQAELIDYTKRLLAMGIETQKLVPTMKSLGDIAAGVGKEKLPQIVLAFGQVATKTKLAGGELKQFTEAGVPLIAALAAQLNVGEKEIIKLTEAGKIGFKDVEKAIENLTTGTGKFSGLMAKQAQTTQGLLSTLKDNVNLALAAFGEGFNIALKDILKSATALTNGLDRDKMRSFGESVGNAVKFLVEFGPALLKVISVYAAYRVAASAAETVTSLFSQTLKVNPIGLWVAGLTAAVQVASALYNNLTKLSEAQQLVNDSTLQAAKDSKENIQASTDLFAVIRDGAASYDQKHAAVQRLLEQYPEYLGDIKTESQLLANLDVAQQRVNEGIVQEAVSRIKAQKIAEFTNQILEKRLALAKAERESGGVVVNADGSTEVVNSRADAIREDIAQIEGVLKQFDKDFNKVGSDVVKTVSASTKSFLTGIDADIANVREALASITKGSTAETELKNRLDALLRSRTKAINDVTQGAKAPKKDSPDGPDKDAEAKARKSAKDELERLKAATQQRVNEATIRNLKLGKLEKDFEIELLQIKAEGIQGNKEKGIKGELEFLESRKKLFVGEYEKTESELLKIQDSIRDKQNAEALNDLKEAAEKRQTALELEFAKGLITEGSYKIRSLEIKRGEYAEKLNLLKAQGREFTSEYAKTLLEQSRVESQITSQTLDNSLSEIKNGTAKKLDVLEQEYEIGKISEAQYQEEKLQIIIEGLNRQLAALEAGGNKESDLYRQLYLQKIKAQHEQFDRQIEIELAGVQGMSNAEKDALTERLEKGRINRNNYDLLLLEDKEAVLQKELAILKAHGDATKAQQEKIEAEITAVKKSEAEKQRAIEKENQEYKSRIMQASAGLFKDILQFEIDALSKSTEEKKKNAEKIKKLQRAQLIISSIAEIAEIWKSYASMPILGQILAGVQTAVVVARTASGLNQIDAQSFAKGGFTGYGLPYTDESGERPAGIVHAGEYVIPRRLVESKQLAPVIRQLEVIRTRGYADGGYVNTTPNSSTILQSTIQNNMIDMTGMVMELKALRSDVSTWQTRLKADIYRDEWEAKAAQDVADRAAATI